MADVIYQTAGKTNLLPSFCESPAKEEIGRVTQGWTLSDGRRNQQFLLSLVSQRNKKQSYPGHQITNGEGVPLD